ncbi:putative proteinD(P)H-QUINONE OXIDOREDUCTASE SUBUNIT S CHLOROPLASTIC [Salix koriyanagi]|uniref:Uncharacterized protein n=1 Tax=Salix koriyanagi TaxID=2511006 RepID=A0A9Q0Q8K6_9ROSI|nr:putative proteinD(P)H-QUINONE OXIDOREDUCTASE SUBUNIT S CHLOROPLASTIC [Salix koriyanagi]
MASSITPQSALLRSNFLGQNNFPNHHHHKPYSFDTPKNIGLQQELERNIEEEAPPAASEEENSGNLEISSVPEDGFEKELMGLTGGFPGGEKGLEKFIEENPPPKKQSVAKLTITNKPKPPELPLLLPGMIAIVKNPNNPFYMYTGIVQRITDGKAGSYL